jgi:hypothetical protein
MAKITTILASAAALGLAAIATPASAAIQLCTSGASCVTGTTNVNLEAYSSAGTPTVTGTVGIGGPLVTFTSTNGLLDTNPGAATVFRADGQDLTQLTFSILSGFSAAEFNLENGSPSSFQVTLTNSLGEILTQTFNGLQGSNVFYMVAPSGQTYTSASFTSLGGGFNDLKQLRVITAAAAVPEPATWALMLLGFGGMGVAMRRTRRQTMLQQMA